MGRKWMAVLAGLLIASTPCPGVTQEHHADGHADYRKWFNTRDQNCCSNEDCGRVVERANDGTTEVFVEGQWCPVAPWMLLKTGRSPDWSSSHACVLRPSSTRPFSPCERLICYSGRPES